MLVIRALRAGRTRLRNTIREGTTVQAVVASRNDWPMAKVLIRPASMSARSSVRYGLSRPWNAYGSR